MRLLYAARPSEPPATAAIIAEVATGEVRLEPGVRVKAKFGVSKWGAARTKWYLGVIDTVRDDGMYKIVFDDGDVDEKVKPLIGLADYIQNRKN